MNWWSWVVIGSGLVAIILLLLDRRRRKQDNKWEQQHREYLIKHHGRPQSAYDFHHDAGDR